MSKSSQRKRSMYELGQADALRYFGPIYPKSKEYMHGWNKAYTEGCWLTLRTPKRSILPRFIGFSVILTVTIYIGSLIL